MTNRKNGRTIVELLVSVADLVEASRKYPRSTGKPIDESIREAHGLIEELSIRQGAKAQPVLAKFSEVIRDAAADLARNARNNEERLFPS